MGISLKTHKLLWGRSGNKCAFEDCRNDLIADETESDDESVIGDEAHIVSRKEDGPRGVSSLSEEDRDRYDNLILLCKKHHKIVDDQFNFYTVEKLIEMKKNHEKWISDSLTVDDELTKEELAYATYIDEIVREIGFDNWQAWTSWLFGEGMIFYSKLKELEKIPNYIITRFWPKRYPELEDSIYNLKAVLNDFLKVFHYHLDAESLRINQKEEIENKMVRTEKFYKSEYHFDRKVYDGLLAEYEYHIDLITDLVLELTRAANYLIEKIRKYISPSYREEEGKLLITYGPDMDFRFVNYKVEYNFEEKGRKYPYIGLREFMEERIERDLCFGTGINEKYLPNKFDL